MARKKSTIGIIGLGPMGSILAAHLAKHGEDVVVEDIVEELLIIIKEKGLDISGIRKLTTKIDRTCKSISELSNFNPDIIFIATKACILKVILPEIKKIYSPEMKLVSFQNGLGNEQFINEMLGIDTSYRVVINYAGNNIGLGKAQMNWFQPPNFVGSFSKGKYTVDGTTKYIAATMTASGLMTEETPDIKRHVWKKTILNSALCSICAITGETMKEAMELKHSRTLAMDILGEGLAVAKADGYDFGLGALKQFTSYLEKGGNHKPSMLIDVENKRPTEVDFMSGAISFYGEKYGIATPVNSTFTKLLKTIETRYSKPS
ncbi:MAG: ketopantoate reductase family protein [Candidatus Bathyarchaeota archaeon]|nr:MAG: ketopantoate reductase family protein [Candidatus Bathyarchaeota archaeon]